MQETAPLLDVLIVGAGISGIGCAYHIQKKCPDLSYSIIEARGDLGGTWIYSNTREYAQILIYSPLATNSNLEREKGHC